MTASSQERVAAQRALAELPWSHFLREAVVPYEDDVTRLIVHTHETVTFAPVAHLPVGDFLNWLPGDAATPEALAARMPVLMLKIAAGVSKLCRTWP